MPPALHLSAPAIKVRSGGTELGASREVLARQYQVGARLARELLMIHDRIDGQLGLTHETLSTMLGTRRLYLTEALNRFEETKLISKGEARF